MPEQHAAAPPLESSDTMDSHSIDELRDAVQRHTIVHDVVSRGGRPHGVVATAAVGALNLVYVRYGAHVVVDAVPTRNRFTLTVPLGPMDVCAGGVGPSATVRGGFVLGQDRRTLMDPEPFAGALVVSTRMSRLEEHLTGLNGSPVGRTLRFLPPGEGTAVGPPGLLESSWRLVCQTINSCEGAGLAPLIERQLEDVLLSGILLALPHNCAADLTSDGRRRVPHDVTDRAVDWLERHYEEPVTVHDLARAMNLGVRQLQQVFRERSGMTPTEALREIRYRQARRLLTQPTASGTPPTVTTVAHQCGFTHLSRFAIAYRERFGESPSESARRVRSALGFRADDRVDTSLR